MMMRTVLLQIDVVGIVVVVVDPSSSSSMVSSLQLKTTTSSRRTTTSSSSCVVCRQRTPRVKSRSLIKVYTRKKTYTIPLGLGPRKSLAHVCVDERIRSIELPYTMGL